MTDLPTHDGMTTDPTEDSDWATRCASKLCDECPFRPESMAGYLGPWKSPLHFQAYVNAQQPVACHMTVDHENDPEAKRTKVCAGSIAHLIQICSLPRPGNPLRQHVEAMETRPNWPEIKEATMGYREFYEHHFGRLPTREDMDKAGIALATPAELAPPYGLAFSLTPRTVLR